MTKSKLWASAAIGLALTWVGAAPAASCAQEATGVETRSPVPERSNGRDSARGEAAALSAVLEELEALRTDLERTRAELVQLRVDRRASREPSRYERYAEPAALAALAGAVIALAADEDETRDPETRAALASALEVIEVLQADIQGLQERQDAIVSALVPDAGTQAANVGDGCSDGSGADSLQCGDAADASGENATAIGDNAIASGEDSTAIGAGAVASLQDATAIGDAASASGLQATAMGSGANATGAGATAVGFNTDATAADATALGNG
jgi:hypothetical protein